MKIVPPEQENPALQGVPGCGLATYGGLLIVFMLVSLVGSFVSLIAILFVPGAQGPSPLKTGAEVHVWQLQPMRDAGLLELTDLVDEALPMAGPISAIGTGAGRLAG